MIIVINNPLINTALNYFLCISLSRKSQNLQSLQNQKKRRSPEKEKEKVPRSEHGSLLLATLDSLCCQSLPWRSLCFSRTGLVGDSFSNKEQLQEGGHHARACVPLIDAERTTCSTVFHGPLL